jgi:hypothetical protein
MLSHVLFDYELVNFRQSAANQGYPLQTKKARPRVYTFQVPDYSGYYVSYVNALLSVFLIQLSERRMSLNK